MREPRVCVVGMVSARVVVRVERLPAVGEVAAGAAGWFVPSGLAVGYAVMAARLGASVRFVGTVGGDAVGTVVADRLAAEGIDCAYLTRHNGSTGLDCALVDPTGQHLSATVEPVHPPPEPDEIRAARRAFEPADIVVCPSTLPAETVLAARRLGGEVGVRTLWHLTEPLDRVTPILEHADVVVVEWPAGVEAAGKAAEPVIDQTLRQLRERGALLAIGLRGGEIWLSGDTELVLPTPDDPATSFAPSAQAAFTGTLAVALARGHRPERAVALAAAARRLTQARAQAPLPFPTGAEVERERRTNSA